MAGCIKQLRLLAPTATGQNTLAAHIIYSITQFSSGKIYASSFYQCPGQTETGHTMVQTAPSHSLGSKLGEGS